MNLRVPLAALGLVLTGISLSTPVYAQQMCMADLDGNGDAADPGETAACTQMEDGGAQCPIGAVACDEPTPGTFSCPLGTQFACQTPFAGGPATCSPNACIDTSANAACPCNARARRGER
jgi:conjugal transfer mating pair stabilization protein TraN